jgi:hypothetical protein
MNINLQIERLILEGVVMSPEGQTTLQSALESELTSLLSVGELQPEFAANSTVGRLTGGTIQITADRNPVALGRQIARAVYVGIGQ